MVASKDAHARCKPTEDDAPSPQIDNAPSLQIEPKINWRQVMGCLSATSISFAGGVSLAYTSSLFPALQAPDSDIPATPEQCAWLASSTALTALVGALMSGFIMEHFGRLTAIQITTLPFCVAWIITATAHSFEALLIARILIGVVYMIGNTAAVVLVTETALKKYRGALASVGLSLHAFGTLFGYIVGAFLDWRTFAWVCVLTPFIPFALACFFTAESPLWLRSRRRMKKAERVSKYYYGDSNYVVQAVVLRSPSIQTVDVEKPTPTPSSNQPSFSYQLWKLLTLPSGLKPLIILNVTFLLLNWCGAYIILVNGVTFFQDAGSTIDPYYATIMIGVMRFIASFITIFLLRHFKRRPLMLISTLGMTICMVASAYATRLVLQGKPTPFPSWFTVACVVIYNLAATIGIQTIPWTMASELFPQRVRGAAQSVNMVMSNFFLFTSLQAYPWMMNNIGGSVGIQYFFGAVSFLAAIHTWIFYPETHGKSLSEIEDYFVKNTIYLGHKK